MYYSMTRSPSHNKKREEKGNLCGWVIKVCGPWDNKPPHTCAPYSLLMYLFKLQDVFVKLYGPWGQ